jgi:hypothetical protein
MFFSVAEEGESGGAEEDGDVSEEATGEDDEVSCHCDCMPATSSVDMLCSCSTKFPRYPDHFNYKCLCRRS